MRKYMLQITKYKQGRK